MLTNAVAEILRDANDHDQTTEIEGSHAELLMEEDQQSEPVTPGRLRVHHALRTPHRNSRSFSTGGDPESPRLTSRCLRLRASQYSADPRSETYSVYPNRRVSQNR